MHNTIHGQPATQFLPQSSMNSIQTPSLPKGLREDSDPVPPYPGEQVPALAKQPKTRFASGGTITTDGKIPGCFVGTYW